MKKELESLMALAGIKGFDKQLDNLHRKHKDDPKSRKEIAAFIKAGVAASGKRIERLEKEVNFRGQMG